MEENNNMETTSVVEPPKRKSNIGLIVFLIILVLGLAGYICYDKFFSKEESTKIEENKKDTANADEKDSNGTLTQSSLDKIKPYTVDMSLGSVGLLKEEDYSGVDLLQNPNFKFAFAFFFGTVEYADYYVEDSSVEDYESCGIAISFDNYKKVYKNIYGEKYTSNTIPDGTDFKMTDKGIWGCIITGYGEPVYFERESNKSGEYLASIKALEDEVGYVTTGRIKINYNNQKDGLLSIKELRITYND